METIKMSKYFICALAGLALSFVPSKAQEIDSLKKIIQGAKLDTTKIKALNMLGWAVMYDNPDTAILLGRQALEIANAKGNPKYIANTLSNIGVYFDLKGDYDTALHYHFKAITIREKQNERHGIAASYNNIAIILMAQSDYPQANRYLLKSLHIHNELGNKRDVASCYSTIGNLYIMKSDYIQALDNHLKALRIRDELNDKKGLADSYSNIGIIYKRQHNPSKALEYYNKSLDLDFELANIGGVASTYSNIGIIYKQQHQYGKALDYFYRSKNIRSRLKQKELVAITYNNIGSLFMDVYEQSKDVHEQIGLWASKKPSILLDSALHYSQAAFEINLSLDSEESMTYNLTNMGMINVKKKQFDKAVNYFQRAIDLAEKIGSLERAYEGHKGAADAYKMWSLTINDARIQSDYLLKSIDHLDQYAVLRDSIFDEEKQKDIGKLEARHEYEMADIKRAQDEKEHIRVLEEQKNRTNNLQYSASLFGICLLFGGVFFLGRLKLPKWAVELSVFLPFLILFEFLLVFTDPYLDSWTGGEPGFKLLTNAALAGLIFPIHNFLERSFKRRLFKSLAPDNYKPIQSSGFNT